jgi:hypothetical protein
MVNIFVFPIMDENCGVTLEELLPEAQQTPPPLDEEEEDDEMDLEMAGTELAGSEPPCFLTLQRFCLCVLIYRYQPTWH